MLRSPRLYYGFKQRVISNLTGVINQIYGTLNNPHMTPAVYTQMIIVLWADGKWDRMTAPLVVTSILQQSIK